MTNALTVDVEDWFQVSNFDSYIRREDWEHLPSRVEANTRRLLDMFEAQSVRGTFFVLGWVAERFPSLVGEIRSRGHEIASHGYGHELVYRLGPHAFAEDLQRSVEVIGSAAGVRPRGYRAPSFSIDARSLWALDVLAEQGFLFDSSVFPVRHHRYGMPSFPRVPRRIRTRRGEEIVEFPLTTLRLPGWNLGASGGAYLRLFPPYLLRTAFRRMNDAGEPAVLYVHPWEVDADQPRLPVGALVRFLHYTNLARTGERLRGMLGRFRFAPMSEVLRTAPGLRDAPAVRVAA